VTDPAAWCVYILRCADGTLYTGITNRLDRRLAGHRTGRASRYTRSRLPVRLVHVEPAADRSAALRREAEIKRLDRKSKLALAGPGRRARPAAAEPPEVPAAPVGRAPAGRAVRDSRRRRR
jgi:putative endonuclease